MLFTDCFKGGSWSPLVVGDEGCIGPNGKLCLLQTPKIMQQMHGIIPYIFDFLVDPVVHFLVLKSSMHKHTERKSIAIHTYRALVTFSDIIG